MKKSIKKNKDKNNSNGFFFFVRNKSLLDLDKGCVKENKTNPGTIARIRKSRYIQPSAENKAKEKKKAEGMTSSRTRVNIT